VARQSRRDGQRRWTLIDYIVAFSSVGKGHAEHTVVLGGRCRSGDLVHSYVTEDKTKTYCVYDGPSPEAIRRAARRNNLPADKVTEGCALDPYFYA
jgi:hypothetical protein